MKRKPKYEGQFNDQDDPNTNESVLDQVGVSAYYNPVSSLINQSFVDSAIYTNTISGGLYGNLSALNLEAGIFSGYGGYLNTAGYISGMCQPPAAGYNNITAAGSIPIVNAYSGAASAYSGYINAESPAFVFGLGNSLAGSHYEKVGTSLGYRVPQINGYGFDQFNYASRYNNSEYLRDTYTRISETLKLGSYLDLVIEKEKSEPKPFLELKLKIKKLTESYAATADKYIWLSLRKLLSELKNLGVFFHSKKLIFSARRLVHASKILNYSFNSDLREGFRRIMHFAFKNLDDEDDSSSYILSTTASLNLYRSKFLIFQNEKRIKSYYTKNRRCISIPN